MYSKELIEKLEEKENPAVKASLLSRYVSISLKANDITLFEAYSIYKEVMKLMRQSYMGLARNEVVRITTCLQLLNMKMIYSI